MSMSFPIRLIYLIYGVLILELFSWVFAGFAINNDRSCAAFCIDIVIYSKVLSLLLTISRAYISERIYSVVVDIVVVSRPYRPTPRHSVASEQ